MKKGICYLLLLCFCVSMLSGCGVKKEYTYPHDQTLRLDASKEDVVSKCGLKIKPWGGYCASDISIVGYQSELNCWFDKKGRMYTMYYALPINTDDSDEEIYAELETQMNRIYGMGREYNESENEKGIEWTVTLPEDKLFRIYLRKSEVGNYIEVDRLLPDGTKYKPKYNKLPE